MAIAGWPASGAATLTAGGTDDADVAATAGRGVDSAAGLRSVALGTAAALGARSSEVGFAPLDSWHPTPTMTNDAAPKPNKKANERFTPLLYTANRGPGEEMALQARAWLVSDLGPVDWNQGRVYPAGPEWDQPMKINCYCCTLSLLLAGLSLSRPAHADEPLPDSLVKSSKATEGTTDVATSGFEKADKAKADAKDATELEISAGGLASAGNSRSIAATTAGKFRLRRRADQVGAAVAANYAESQVNKGEGLQTTVENFQGKVRYDRFLAGSFAVFGSVSARHDRFQGLALRINLDPGASYYFIDEDKQQLWLEAGYDFQHDIRRDDAIADAYADGYFLAKTNDRHSLRAFAGYSSELSDSVTVATGLEYLQGLNPATNYRFNWDGSVNSAVGKGFSIATAVSVRYDHNPIPGVENTDIVTSISLVYHLL